MALISRYHRRTGPRKKHAEFAALPPADQAIVRRLSGLLRVADGLDRGHTAAVDTVTTKLTRDALASGSRRGSPGADLGLEVLGRLAQGRRAGQAVASAEMQRSWRKPARA